MEVQLGFEPRFRALQAHALATWLLNQKWSGWWESNPRSQLGRLKFYHWTTPAYGDPNGIRTRACRRERAMCLPLHQCRILLDTLIWQNWTWTSDLYFFRVLLDQLSYSPKLESFFAACVYFYKRFFTYILYHIFFKKSNFFIGGATATRTRIALNTLDALAGRWDTITPWLQIW